MTIHTRRCERGYVMAALLVAMTVMAIVLSTAIPVFQTVARREREAELVFRGEQYARAIGLFQRKYANANPPDVDVLIRERFLRKKYKDPVTGGDFVVLSAGSPELARAMGTTPQQAQDGQPGRGFGRASGPGTSTNPATGTPRGTPLGFGQNASGQNASGQNTGGQPTRGMSFGGGRGPVTAAGQAANVQAGGGIIAVTSKSAETSLRLYNGKSKYNEWIFMALQASTAAGAGARGAQAPGGRGGQLPGGRGGSVPGGRGNTTSPFGRSTQGRSGFPPVGGR
jgi:type II secretory pathway pseudopilin PulG